MAQDRRAGIFMIDELVEEEMDADAERPQSEVAHVFGKVESGERDGK